MISKYVHGMLWHIKEDICQWSYCLYLCNAADVIFEASVVVGDKLLMAYSVLDPRTVRRELLHLDLNTGKVAPLTFVLVSSIYVDNFRNSVSLAAKTAASTELLLALP